MKTKIFNVTVLSCVLLLALAVCIGVPNAKAATEEEIEVAITNGLICLETKQQTDGSWKFDDWSSDPDYNVATTALVVLKFVDRAKELKPPLDPFDTDPDSPTYYKYATNVVSGFNYIFTHAKSDANGVYFPKDGWLYVYNTGIAMMAVAASNAPDRIITTGDLSGQTYEAALQKMMDWMVFAQNDSNCGIGGWGYQANEQSWADNSNSGYATLGLGVAAASPPDGFGLTIPGSVIIGLDTFINNVQVGSGPYKGGSIYNPCWIGSEWVNILKTGNLLYQLALVGDIITDSRVQNAISFIETYWNNWAGTSDGSGWKGGYQAMFCMMKGLEAFEIETLEGFDIDWFDEVSTYIVENQNDDGCWTHTHGHGGGPAIDTAWALLTLERVVPRVEFGIPSQCVPYGQAFESFDADDYVIIGTPPFTWTWSGNVDLTLEKDGENVFTITYPDGWTGSETITFTVTDDKGKTSNDTATFTVDPVPIVGDIPDQTVPFTTFDLDDYLISPVPSEVTWSYSGDSCLLVSIDGNNVVTITNPGEVCTEPEIITFTATALACDEEVSDSDEATFTPNQPPDCSEAYPSIQEIWPPNHKYVDIEIMGVTDPDGDPVTITITGITQDEPIDAVGNGDGKTSPDGTGVGTSIACVRAERQGTGNGRVYAISFTAIDPAGAECSESVTVCVPHDQGPDHECIDDGQDYDSTEE